MKHINEILKKENPSVEELINCFESIKENGDIAVIKFDGERVENPYTVFISFPIIKQKEIIRADENDLKSALIKVLMRYAG
ncbi:MAG: hypothetical protein IBJ09_07905 [Bacteroidia bacterium]|nr:hypothetical protein [Bacteroidia bacterium]